MRRRVSDYIADFFAGKGMTDVFTVVGGGAMHLNDSFGHHPKLHSTYNHHEQASAMAAECYARVAGKPAIVCVTSGPGAINALNGVVGAYQDSIPMIVVSGQVKSTLTVRQSGLHLRTLGGQEFDIVSALSEMTKYAEMLVDPMRIRYVLEKAYHLATTGRMGPTWIDIPVDIQGTYIETDELQGYVPTEEVQCTDLTSVLPALLGKLQQAKRPVIYAGNGIRCADGVDLLHELAEALDAPVVTCWDSIDLIATGDDYYVGRGGTMGDRAGNFAVQNSDLVLAIGNRLSIYQVGYDVQTWARAAYVVAVDIDPEELKKPTIRVDLPVVADAGDFMRAFLEPLRDARFSHAAWRAQCRKWKMTYPVVTRAHYEQTEPVNVYAFMDALSRQLPSAAITVVANGSASVVGSHSYYIKAGDRFLMNCAISSMGYGLPAALGASMATERAQRIVAIEGDGSIMMNLQELQTMVTNGLPITIFVINNAGYHQIRQTQRNLFQGALVGVGPESGDLGFPSFEKIARAFGIDYVAIRRTGDLTEGIEAALQGCACRLCEVFVDTEQVFAPKSQAKRLPDGRIVSPPLEDMAPFLSREELAEHMLIGVWEE